MMKKMIGLTLALVTLASCGPKRLGCYNRRCLVETPKPCEGKTPTSVYVIKKAA